MAGGNRRGPQTENGNWNKSLFDFLPSSVAACCQVDDEEEEKACPLPYSLFGSVLGGRAQAHRRTIWFSFECLNFRITQQEQGEVVVVMAEVKTE